MFTFLENPKPALLGNNVEDFLRFLNGPGCIVMDGEDMSRTRVFVTLLHGNEPSGVMALFRWIKEQRRPKVRIVCIVASVTTALQPPLFHYRNLPGVRDINRCFQPPFNDEPGKLAQAILNLIHQHQPEAVIDMHNTSGSSPAFGVATHKDHKHEALTTAFSNKLVITHLKLGALMDISEDFFPTVTIEAGGRLDQASHDTAWQGLVYFFSEDDILKLNKPEWQMDILMEPVRIELKSGVSLSYASTVNTEFDVTLLDDLDRLNFTKVDDNIALGWVNRGGLSNFIIRHFQRELRVDDWLRVNNNELYFVSPTQPFMITTNPVIAIDDCLFYSVKAS